MKVSWIVNLLLLMLVTLLITSCNPDEGLDEQTHTPIPSDTQTDAPEPPPTDTPEPPPADTPVPILSISDLEIAIQNLLNSEEIHFEDTFIGDHDGCQLSQGYIGVHRRGNAYARLEQEYADPVTKIRCREIRVGLLNPETYWLDGVILNRWYPSNNFEIIDPESNHIIARKPLQHLSVRLQGIESMEVTSVEVVAKTQKIGVTIGAADRAGEMIFIFEDASQISEIQYNMTFPYESKEFHIVGNIRILDPFDISAPGLGEGGDPYFVLSVLNDILSYSDVTYMVETDNVGIRNYLGSFPSLYVFIRDDVSPERYECSLNQPECQNKFLKYEAMFSNLENILELAKTDYCHVDKTEISFFYSDLPDDYEGFLTVKVANRDRGEATDDYSIVFLFDLSQGSTYDYYGVIQYGKQYCFTGTTNVIAIDSFIDTLHDFSDSFK
jgi:hypothetical protein